MAEEFSLKDLHFSFDLSQTNYEIDTLQNRLLQLYLRADPRFRRAFATNYTQDFLQFLKDKAKLREPVHLSVIGQTRGGKSYTSISIAVFQMACYGKKFTIKNICANAYEFLEKLKEIPEEELVNSCFLIDEEKQSVWGLGSNAKKMKLTDVQNIIAMNNISTIMLNPITWANKEAMYGLRLFGKDRNTKTCRMMLYNLQERGKGGELPLGNVYLPIFTSFLPKDYADELENQYIAKKKNWIRGEMKGSGDVLLEISKKSAENFCKDKKFLELKTRGQKETYISLKMGSEWTKGEIGQIFQLTKLISSGALEVDKPDNEEKQDDDEEDDDEEDEEDLV